MSHPEENNSPATPYTAAEISRLLLHSFYFSQGDLYAHDQIFAYLACNYGYRLNLELVNAADAWAPIKNVLTNRSLHSDQGDPEKEGLAISVGEAKGMLLGHLKKAEPDFDQTRLTQSLIGADFGALIGRRNPNNLGRPRRLAPEEKSTPAKDRFLSHFVYYGFLAKVTPMVEFDAMFAQSVEDFASHPGVYKPFRKRTQGIVDLYLEHHPDDTPLLVRRLGSLGVSNLRPPDMQTAPR